MGYDRDLTHQQITVWLDPISNFTSYKSYLYTHLDEYKESVIVCLMDSTYILVCKLRKICISSDRKIQGTWLKEFDGRVESNKARAL